MSSKKHAAMSRNQKKWTAIIGGVVGAAVIGWIVLMIVIFGKDKPGKTVKTTPEPTKSAEKPTPTPPEKKTVYRLSKEYMMTENGTRYLYTAYEYDEYGRMTVRTEYNETNEVISTDKVIYDASGKIIEIVNTHRRGEENVVTETEFSYYPKGGLQEIIKTEKKTVIDHRVYNEAGKMIKHEWDDYDYRVTETYNDNGDLLLNQKIFPNGEVLGIEENVYSDAGLKTESVSELNGTKDFYIYDTAGKLTKIQTYMNDELFSETVYYPMNNEIHSDKHVFTDEGYYYVTDHYEYDENGKVLRYTLYNHGGGIEENYAYEYNSDGYKTRSEVYDEEFNLRFGFDFEYDDLSVKLGEYAKCVSWDGPERRITQWEETKYVEDEGIPSRTDTTQFYEIHGNQVTAILSINHLNDGENTQIGFYYELDSNGNPSRRIKIDQDGNETVAGEREYVQMEIKNQEN
ncbi:MAG: hypothetical protein J5643_05740 [Lachnospiraceae bacterium]|nr:hypothetical protein [Lachnospiraceae bacterium]